MNAVAPVTLLTPDGVERELRFSLGAQKRIVERFGMTWKPALEKYDSGAIPGILYAMMYDAEQNPPAISLAWLEENLAVGDGRELTQYIISAASQGKATPKDVEMLMKAAEQMNQTGLASGPSAVSVSESPTASSGDSTSMNSAPASSAIDESSTGTGSTSEPLPQQS